MALLKDFLSFKDDVLHLERDRSAALVRVRCYLFLYVRDDAARALPEFKTRAEIGAGVG